jgi:hypothetical protein
MSKKRARQTRVVRRKARNRYICHNLRPYHQDNFEYLCLVLLCTLVPTTRISCSRLSSCTILLLLLKCLPELHTHKNATLYARHTLLSPFLPLFPHHLSKSQRPSNIQPDLFLKLCSPLPPHPRRIHIGRRLIIRLSQHTHHTNQYLFHTLNRTPSFRGVFVVIRVVARRMQDRDTHDTIRIHWPLCQHHPSLHQCSSWGKTHH